MILPYDREILRSENQPVIYLIKYFDSDVQLSLTDNIYSASSMYYAECYAQ